MRTSGMSAVDVHHNKNVSLQGPIVESVDSANTVIGAFEWQVRKATSSDRSPSNGSNIEVIEFQL